MVLFENCKAQPSDNCQIVHGQNTTCGNHTEQGFYKPKFSTRWLLVPMPFKNFFIPFWPLYPFGGIHSSRDPTPTPPPTENKKVYEDEATCRLYRKT
jgi:hypothetical protein